MRHALLCGSCWSDRSLPVALTLNPEPYDVIAEMLDETAPPEWRRIMASVVIERGGRKTVSVGSLCGSLVEPDDLCIETAHQAIMHLGRRAIAPKDMRWIGIWIDLDFTTGTLIARIAHGGPPDEGLRIDLPITKVAHPAICT